MARKDTLCILRVVEFNETFCGLTHDLTWRIFHVYVKKKCVLLGGIVYIYLLSPSSLMCLLRQVFLPLRPVFPY